METSRSGSRSTLVALLLTSALASGWVTGPAIGAAAPRPTCEGRPATLVGTDGADALVGTAGRDVIVAGRGDDVVRGGRGDDLVCAGPGADVLWGGPGDDRLHGEGDRIFEDQGGPGIAGDTLHGGPGDDLLDVGFFVAADTGNFPNTIAWDTAAGPVSVRLAKPGTGAGLARGEGRDRIVSARRLTVLGSSFGDDIDARALVGDVSVVGGAGGDRIRTGAGDDVVLTETEAVDHAVGDVDVVATGAGDDEVSSYSGADRIFLGDGHDVALTASDAPVTVQGGNGSDQFNATVRDGLVLDGGTGNNTVVLDATDIDRELTIVRRQGTLAAEALAAVVRRFTSYDLIGGAAWTYTGADLPDRVVALSAGPIRMFTFGDNDELWGSAFDDVLDGGPGTDEVHPGAGADTCINVEVGSCA